MNSIVNIIVRGVSYAFTEEVFPRLSTGKLPFVRRVYREVGGKAAIFHTSCGYRVSLTGNFNRLDPVEHRNKETAVAGLLEDREEILNTIGGPDKRAASVRLLATEVLNLMDRSQGREVSANVVWTLDRAVRYLREDLGQEVPEDETA